MTKEELIKKIDLLRERYKREPDKRKTIEIQARLLQMALEKL